MFLNSKVTFTATQSSFFTTGWQHNHRATYVKPQQDLGNYTPAGLLFYSRITFNTTTAAAATIHNNYNNDNNNNNKGLVNDISSKDRASKI